jgi:hypothetical protein
MSAMNRQSHRSANNKSNQSNQSAPTNRRFSLPWRKQSGPQWFGQDHPAQVRNLQKSNWFPAPPEPEPPKPPLKLSYRPWMTSFSSLLMLMGIGGAVTGVGILSIQYLTNPRSVIWVNNYLPAPLQLKIPGWDQPRTMKEITAELRRTGLSLGDRLDLSDRGDKADFLIPVLKTEPDCVEICTQIVELRVYRPTRHPYAQSKEPYFQMVSQLPVAGMEDWFVQEPFVNAQVDVPPPSATVLGFESVEMLEEQAPKDGRWLTMKGERSQTGAYGQILHYNPSRAALTAMVPWTSPGGELPHWENVTSGGTSELVVDHTIGLEPLFQVFQVDPDRSNNSGFKLREITLASPALSAAAFGDAMKLAQNGLWTLAAAMIESLGKDALNDNTLAQGQRDLIRYHANVFKAQADQASASTSQQVQSSLMDGRWEKAQQIAKLAPDDREDVLELLNSDTGQLLKRLKAATAVNPGNPALQAWNVAMKLARAGKGSTIAWLKPKPVKPEPNKAIAGGMPPITPSIAPSPVAEPVTGPATEPVTAPPVLPTPLSTPVAAPPNALPEGIPIPNTWDGANPATPNVAPTPNAPTNPTPRSPQIDVPMPTQISN